MIVMVCQRIVPIDSVRRSVNLLLFPIDHIPVQQYARNAIYHRPVQPAP